MLTRRNLLRTGAGLAAGIAAGTGAGAASARRPAAAYSGQPAWRRLRASLDGELVRPADAGYVQAKQLQIAQYDTIDPQGIAYCETVNDVRRCVRFGRAYGVPLRVRAGGHNLLGWSTVDGLVVDVSRLDEVAAKVSTVTLDAGIQSVDALAALKSFDRQIPTGTCPTVAQGGFVSGGGIGFQTRKFSLAADRVVAATVVLADGDVVRATATEEPDLFWALRGGGGNNFGVVVEWEVRPIDAPVAVNFDLMWPIATGVDVFSAWQSWVVNGSEDIGTSLVVVPPSDAGGAALVMVTGAYLGTKADLEKALDQLGSLAGTAPLMRTVGAELPFAESMHVKYCQEKTLEQCHREGTTPTAVLPRTPFQRQSYQFVNRVLTRSEIESVLSTWDSHTDLRHRYVQCMAIGGAMSRVDRTGTAFVHRDAMFLLGYQVGLDTPAPPADVVAEATAWTDAGATALAPLASGSYINFPSSRRLTDWASSTYGENLPRLRQVKAAYDPTGLFRHPQSIPA